MTLGPLLPRGLAPVARRVSQSSIRWKGTPSVTRSRFGRSVTRVLLALAVALVLAILLAVIPVIYGSESAHSTGLGFLLLPACALLAHPGR